MTAAVRFQTFEGKLDVSPYAFPEIPEAYMSELVDNIQAAFARCNGFIARYEPPHGLKYRVSRSITSMSDRMFACIKGSVLNDRFGSFGRDCREANGEVKFSLFIHFAKILNADGNAEVLSTDWGGRWQTPYPEIKEKLTGNETTQWSMVVDAFGKMHQRGHPIGQWVFEPKPGKPGGWASSR